MSDLLLSAIVGSLPRAFVEGLITTRSWVYKESYEATFNDPSIEKVDAEYLWPHKRRVLFEKKLRDLAALSDLKTTIQETVTGSHKYTLVHSPQLLLTCSHVYRDVDRLQPARFRDQHALLNHLLPQFCFPFYEETKTEFSEGVPFVPVTAELFGVILHRIDDEFNAGFLKLGIPSEDNSNWERTYDFSELLAAYPAVAPVEPELFPEEVLVTWRRRDFGQQARGA